MENKQFLPLSKMMSIPHCGLPLCEMSVKKYLPRNSFMKGPGMLVISLTLETEVSLLHGF